MRLRSQFSGRTARYQYDDSYERPRASAEPLAQSTGLPLGVPRDDEATTSTARASLLSRRFARFLRPRAPSTTLKRELRIVSTDSRSFDIYMYA